MPRDALLEASHGARPAARVAVGVEEATMPFVLSPGFWETKIDPGWPAFWGPGPIPAEDAKNKVIPRRTPPPEWDRKNRRKKIQHARRFTLWP